MVLYLSLLFAIFYMSLSEIDTPADFNTKYKLNTTIHTPTVKTEITPNIPILKTPIKTSIETIHNTSHNQWVMTKITTLEDTVYACIDDDNATVVLWKRYRNEK